MRRGSYPSLRILQPRPRELRKGEEEQHDPRGQRSPSSPGDLATRRPARQCDPGLPGGRDLPDALLPMASTVSAVRGRGAAAPADAADPLAPPSHPGAGARGPGVRPAVAHARARADRDAIAPAAVGRLAHQRLGRLRDLPAARPADPLGAADALGGACGDRRPADRAHPPAPAAAARGSAASRRPRLPGCVLHRQAQGRGQGLAADGVRCGLLLWHRDPRPAGHPADGDSLLAHARGARLRAGRASDPGGADRWRARMADALCSRLSGARYHPPADATPARLDEWLRRALAGDDPDRTVARGLSPDVLPEHRATGAGLAGVPALLQLGPIASRLPAPRPYAGRDLSGPEGQLRTNEDDGWRTKVSTPRPYWTL